ncbi:hypothetical protein FRC11_002701 [Ceratobasidium sp. 423]|nr:hypothetical protein FRC11_002701 [Ceratobasidium sp. 423]
MDKTRKEIEKRQTDKFRNHIRYTPSPAAPPPVLINCQASRKPTPNYITISSSDDEEAPLPSLSPRRQRASPSPSLGSSPPPRASSPTPRTSVIPGTPTAPPRQRPALAPALNPPQRPHNVLNDPVATCSRASTVERSRETPPPPYSLLPPVYH